MPARFSSNSSPFQWFSYWKGNNSAGLVFVLFCFLMCRLSHLFSSTVIFFSLCSINVFMTWLKGFSDLCPKQVSRVRPGLHSGTSLLLCLLMSVSGLRKEEAGEGGRVWRSRAGASCVFPFAAGGSAWLMMRQGFTFNSGQKSIGRIKWSLRMVIYQLQRKCICSLCLFTSHHCEQSGKFIVWSSYKEKCQWP